MLQQIKMLVLGIITLCRRALCCFSRRRKLSHSGSSGSGDQLQAVNVIVERGDFAASPGNPPGGRSGGPKERDWNSWDDSPRTVEEHIEQYRQRMAQPPTPPKEEPEPDFFSVSWHICAYDVADDYSGGQADRTPYYEGLQTESICLRIMI